MTPETRDAQAADGVSIAYQAVGDGPRDLVWVSHLEAAWEVDGRYWADFNRANPIEAAARAQAWTGTALALIAELGVGTVTASTLQVGLGLAGLFGAIGGTFVLMGLGLVWATRPETAKVPVLRPALHPA